MGENEAEVKNLWEKNILLSGNKACDTRRVITHQQVQVSLLHKKPDKFCNPCTLTPFS